MTNLTNRLQKVREQAKRQETISQYKFQSEVKDCANILNALDPTKRRPWIIDVLNEMYTDQRGLCAICGHHMEHGDYEVDHKIPHKYGGGNESSNIQLTHTKCNREKGSSVDPALLLRYLEDRFQNLKI
ncbi:HNH endonuclease [Photobacterium toruni]|uniref:HNH endonuclease n=1 Tax=Photobacterium toruni TaxID=1935446 RepID=UPI00399A3180